MFPLSSPTHFFFPPLPLSSIHFIVGLKRAWTWTQARCTQRLLYLLSSSLCCSVKNLPWTTTVIQFHSTLMWILWIQHICRRWKHLCLKCLHLCNTEKFPTWSGGLWARWLCISAELCRVFLWDNLRRLHNLSDQIYPISVVKSKKGPGLLTWRWFQYFFFFLFSWCNLFFSSYQ